MSAPTVSFLLPCRDAAGTLEASLRSLAGQSWTDFEVVSVDDGSRDRTAAILGEWARRDGRFREPLSTGGRGLVPALNAAAEAAQGELLARMDADDVAHPERLACQTRLLSRRPDLAACGTGVLYVPRQGLGSGLRRYEAWLNSLRTPGEVARDRFIECPVAHPTLVVRTEALEAVGGYRDRGWPEDWDLLLRLHAAGMRAANVGRRLLRWRRGEDRLSRNAGRYSREAFRRCRVHYLLRDGLPQGRPLVVWGAGSVGKRFTRELRGRGGRVRAWVEVDPRKVGQEIHGLSVWSPEELSRELSAAGGGGRPYALVAVGAPGAREEIREELVAMGLAEGDDFRAVA